MAGDSILTPDEFRQLIHYNPKTGKMFWKLRPASKFPSLRGAKVWNSRFAGAPALSTRNKKGYLCGRVFGQPYLAHRVAWAIHHGEWPSDQIDHINGKRADNRLCNLRVVSNQENARNRRRTKKAESGVTGVTYVPGSGRWQARIGVDGEYMHIGVFDTIAEAAEARRHAERMYGFHVNHGGQ